MNKDEIFRKTEEVLMREPSVLVRVGKEGHLWIDGKVIIHDAVKKIHPNDLIQLEIALIRAIEDAESRTRDKENRFKK